MKIIIATIKSWNIEQSQQLQEQYKDVHDVRIVTAKKELTYELVKSIEPRYVFFPHWSWVIPRNIYENFECVVFHVTDVPYGRGGSPLQNLIVRKKYNTKISALRVIKDMDAGPVYRKEPISIHTGSARDILTRVSGVIFSKMIPFLLRSTPQPLEQRGEVVLFKRRKPQESEIGNSPQFATLNDWYDFIRMLDGEGYPHAYLMVGDYKLILVDAQRESDKVTGKFIIQRSNGTSQ